MQEVKRDTFQVKASELCAEHEAADRLILAAESWVETDPDKAAAMRKEGAKAKAAAEAKVMAHYEARDKAAAK
jgi:hypothetical protein